MLLAASTLRTTSWPGVPRFGADPSGAPIDSNGNLATKTEGTDNWGYEWNARNELTRVTKNSVEQARFSYDPTGRRVEKVAGGVTASYTYDGARILREVQGSTTLKYVLGEGVDELLAVDDGTTLSYFHADGLDSIVQTTNAAGSVTLTRQYDAWGNLEAGMSQAGHAFTGREWDPETGLYYYRARYYDPRAGTFTAEDPIGILGGLNLYGYVFASPTTYVDPFGEAIDYVGYGPDELRRVQHKISRLRRTQRGRELLECLENDPNRTLKIRKPWHDRLVTKPRAGYESRKDTIWFDPDYHPLMYTTDGIRRISGAAVLGHELGHACGCINPWDEVLNVNFNENAVRRELGEPLRTNYRTPFDSMYPDKPWARPY